MRFLLPALILSIASATAQPTLTVSTNMPVAGLTNTLYRASSAPSGPGPSGANVTWDFTNLAYTATASSAYVACPGGPGCSTYPTATLSGYEVLTGGTVYYNTGSSALSVVGGSGNGIAAATFSDPEDVVRFPLTYNNTFTDGMRASFTQFGQPFTRTGSSTIMADGWGTLKLPFGLTVPNVLRVKRTGSYTDSSSGIQFATATTTTYSYYSTAYKEFLLFIVQGTFTTTGGSPVSGSAVAFTLPGINSVRDIDRGHIFVARPNPAQAHVAVRWAAGTQATLTLQDLTGRTVAQTTGRGEAAMDVADLPRGMYLLRATDASGTSSTQKISLR